MEKNTFLAIALSLLVLLAWQSWVAKVYHIDNKEVMIKNTAQQVQDSPAIAIPKEPLTSPHNYVSLAEIETDKLRAEFVNPGAILNKIHFKDYNLDFSIVNALGLLQFKDKFYTLQKSNDKLFFSYGENGHFVDKNLTFHSNSYRIDIEIIYKNTTSEAWNFADQILLDSISNKVDPAESRLFEVALYKEEHRVERKNPLQIKNRFVQSYQGGWMGFRDRYSCIIIQPSEISNKDTSYYIEKYKDNSIDIGLDLGEIVVPANAQTVFRYIVYCGPQDIKFLKPLDLGLEEIIYFGGLDFIANVLLAGMRFFHNYLHSWGLAIILISILIFFILYPLTLKQMQAMRKMQMLQPQIEILRQSYKDNPQRLNKEIMDLYKKHKANPLGGCLPMLLQMPVFLAFLQALPRSVELKGAAFLWIKDLAEPDRLFVFSKALPFLGKELNILPIAVAIGMFFQQKLSMKTNAANATMQEQQKMMLVFMPVIFGFIFYRFPSGLNLYWFMSTILNTIFQWKNLKIQS